MFLESKAALETCCCCFPASACLPTLVLPCVGTLNPQDTPPWAGRSDATSEAKRYKQERENHGKADLTLCHVQTL